MFSIINFYLQDANVLDLFAGSGSLGIESISRGAKKCTFVENDTSAMHIVKKNIQKTNFEDSSETLQMDFKTFLNIRQTPFNMRSLQGCHFRHTLNNLL